jgi:hypothetical protein
MPTTPKDRANDPRRVPRNRKAKPVTKNRDEVDVMLGQASAAADNEAKASRPTNFPKNSPYYEA